MTSTPRAAFRVDVVEVEDDGRFRVEIHGDQDVIVGDSIEPSDAGTWGSLLARCTERGLDGAEVAHELKRRLVYEPPAPSPIAGAPDATGVPWQTAAELTSHVPAAVEWLWRDFLPFGTVVELDAKLKTGKTTLVGLLLRSILEGRPFIGRPVHTCPVVYLSEEGSRTFRSLLTRTRLGERTDLHVLSKRQVPTLTWPQLVAAARDKVISTGARLVVVDTLGKLAGFQDDAENVSGPAMQAMNPLQALASERNAVVLVLRHDRKAGGEVGESARGSSAIGGDVDVILQLTRVGGDGHERQRYLRTLSRFDETPAELTIELVDGEYREAIPAVVAAGRELLAMLPDGEGDAVAVVDLLPELQAAGHPRKTVYDAVAMLKGRRELGETTGKGPTGRKRTLIWRTVVPRGEVARDDRNLNTDGRPVDSGPGRPAVTDAVQSSRAPTPIGAWGRPSDDGVSGDTLRLVADVAPLPEEPCAEELAEPPGPEEDGGLPVEWLAQSPA